jgi:DNA polymerase-3 subunit alpha (Gram-positive type)
MLEGAPPPEEALASFHGFCGEGAVLAAHNADFDTRFVFGKGAGCGIKFANRVIDTVALCRLAYPELKNHKLNTVAKHLRIPFNHHRAVDDAECTSKIMLQCFEEFSKNGARDMKDIDALSDINAVYKHAKLYHVILLAKNKRGLRNLYKLISHAHIDYFYRKPRMPKSLIEEHREGLIIGSACEQNELYRAVLADAPDKKLEKIAGFYDYLEIQPLAIMSFCKERRAKEREDIKSAIKR